jgi:hypothetical protein
MKNLLLILLFSSSIYSNEYLFSCSTLEPERGNNLTYILKINTEEQYMERTVYGGFQSDRIAYVKTYRYEGDYKETDRIIRIGLGTSKSIEHPDGNGTIEVWSQGYHAFDKLAGIYEHTYGAYDNDWAYSCIPHKKLIP